MKRLRYGIAAATVLASPFASAISASAFSMNEASIDGIVVDNTAKTITLTKDVSACLDFTDGDSYVLDLGEYTLTAANSTCGPIALHRGSLVITSGTAGKITNTVDSVNPVINNEAGELIIRSGTFVNENITAGRYTPVVNTTTGDTTIRGGTFIQKGAYNAIQANGYGYTDIIGGTFTNTDENNNAGVIGTTGDASASIEITGGTFSAGAADKFVIFDYADAIDHGNAFTIVGGTFSGKVFSSYNPIITGGTFSIDPATAARIYDGGESAVNGSALKDGYVSVENNSGKFVVSAFDFSVNASASVEVGGTITISPEVEPSGYTPSGFSYVSKNPTTATVSDAGVVTGVAVGTAEISVSSDFSVSKTVLVEVTAATSSSSEEPSTPSSEEPSTPSSEEPSTPSSEEPSTPAAVALKTITLDKKSIELNKGGEVVLNVTYGPEDFDLKNLGYISGIPKDFKADSSTESPFAYCYTFYDSDKDEDDVTKLVCNGYEAGSGKVVVTARDDDGDIATAEIDVTVKDALESGYAYIDDGKGNYVVAGANFEKPIEGADHLDIKFKALPEAQADNKELKLVVDIKVYDKAGEVVPVKDNKVTVTIQVEKAMLGGEFKHFQIIYLDENGEAKEWFDPTKVEYDDTWGIYYITFETSHFSQYGVLASNTAFASAELLNKVKAPDTGAVETEKVSGGIVLPVIFTIALVAMSGAAIFSKR